MRHVGCKNLSVGLTGCCLAWATQFGLASGVFAVGSDSGILGEARLYDGVTLQAPLDVQPYVGYSGGVRVACGDINGDRHPDLVTAPGANLAPYVYVLDGPSGASLGDFYAFDPTFKGGVYVAVGDVNGDGRADIIAGTGATGAPLVRVFSGVNRSVLRSFFAYSPSFLGGVRVAAGDVNGDGRADIIVAPGPDPTSTPDIKVFDGVTLAVIDEFLAYSPMFTGGVYVAAADLDGDGHADIITGADAGGTPDVHVFSGVNHASLGGFLAYPASFTGGVRVAAGDIDGDGKPEILTASGAGTAATAAHVKVFAWPNLNVVHDFFPFPQFTGGAFVSAPLPNDAIFANGFEAI